MRGTACVTSQTPEGTYAALEQYGRELTNIARKGKLDPVIGRDDEIRRVIQILSRRTKNNPVLIGEPGVGKPRSLRVSPNGSSVGTCPIAERKAGDRSRPGGAGRRSQVPRRVRGAPEGGAEGDPGARRHHSVHRRAPHRRGRGRGRRGHGRLQHAQADAGAGRASPHRRHDPGRVPQAYREGRGPRAPLPAGGGRAPHGRGHHLHPPRIEGALRDPPADPHLRRGHRGRRDALGPLHLRSFPSRQGDRSHGRGRGQADGDHIQIRKSSTT